MRRIFRERDCDVAGRKFSDDVVFNQIDYEVQFLFVKFNFLLRIKLWNTFTITDFLRFILRKILIDLKYNQ